MAENTHETISILSDDDVLGKRVSGLANRPTNSSGYGSHGLTAAQLKARMDAYSDEIREKLNDLIELFNRADIPLTSFQWGGEDIANLQELAELLKTPEFTDNLVIHNDAETPLAVNLKNYIEGLKNALEEKLDNDAVSLASLMQGSKGISVDVTEDDTYVDVHPDMTGATPGQVWTVNEGGDGAGWKDYDRGIFTAVQYGVTTYEQITAIINGGKTPVLKNGNNVLYYNGKESGTLAYQFFSVSQNYYSLKATCSISSVWSNFGQTLEQDVNKTATIGASSTDTQYPTAKATYTALNAIRKVAEGKCASYTVDETLTVERIKSDLESYNSHAYYNGQDITEYVLEGFYDYWIRNTEFASSSETLSYSIDDFIAVEIPGNEGFILYNFGDMKTGDVLYVIGTGYPDRWVSGDVYGSSTKTLYTLETVRKEAVGRTVSIAPSQWSNNTATVTVQGVTATNIVICDASDPDVQATAQNTNTLTFTCTKTPTASVTVKVVIL